MNGDAVRALRSELGVSPPRGLVEALEDEELLALAGALEEVRRRQSEELSAATRRALGHVPGPLRGAVRRIVGG